MSEDIRASGGGERRPAGDRPAKARATGTGPRRLADPPYVSQWGDPACNVAWLVRGEDPAAIHDWRADGYADADAYRLWSRSTCGLACLEGIIRAELADDPGRWPAHASAEAWLPGDPKWKLIRRAIDHDVLVPRENGEIDGLYYAPFVTWVAADYGLEAICRPDLPLDEVVARVASGAWYAMLSVSFEIRLAPEPPTHTGGHLVLAHRATRASTDGGRMTPARIVVNNSSGVPAGADDPTRPDSAHDVPYALDALAPYYAGRGILVRRGSAGA